MASWVLGRLLNVLVSDAYVWQAASVSDALTIALAVTYGAVLLPYRSLRSKSLVAALAAVAWLEVAYLGLHYLYDLSFYNVWLCLQAVTFISVTAFYWLRPYRQPTVDVDDEYFYLLCKRPHTPQGFLISMLGFFGTYGGFAIYARGLIYTYKAGILRAIPVTPDTIQKYHVRRGRKITNNALAELAALKNAPWSYKRNCLRLRKSWGLDDGMVKNGT